METETGESEPKKMKIKQNLTGQQGKECFDHLDIRNDNKLDVGPDRGRNVEISGKSHINFTQSGFNDQSKMDNQMLDCFVERIQEEEPFPENFQMENIPPHTDAFHGFIKTGNIESVKAEVSKNLNLKISYDTRNKSALTYALENKQFDIYAYLLSEGFSKGSDPFYDKVFQTLKKEETDEIASCKLKYFQSLKPTPEHVNALIRKTKIASQFLSRSKSYQEVWKFYSDLDAISWVSEVLQVVALFESTISFDFENFGIDKMHPSQPKTHNGVVYESGYIYIAAGGWEKHRNEVLGIIAHEFTHFAMLIVYNNRFLPYALSKADRKVEYAKIVESTETVIDYEENLEEVVSLVYKTEFYKQEQREVELIVRVPHLLAKYKDEKDKIADLKLNFVDLFSFFERRTLPDLSRLIESSKSAKQVKILNDQSGLLRLVKFEEIEFMINRGEECLRKTIENKISIVIGPSIVTLAAIVQALDTGRCTYLLMDSSFFMHRSTQVLKLIETSLTIIVLIKCADEINEYQTEFAEALDHSDLEHRHKFILIMNSEEKDKIMVALDASFLKKSFSNVSILDLKWKDLSWASQKKTLQKTIEFQGKSIHLESFFNINDCRDSILDLIFEGKQLRLNVVSNITQYFFKRKLFLENDLDQALNQTSEVFQAKKNDDSQFDFEDQKIIFNWETMIARLTRESVVLISGIAGTGKSSVLMEMHKHVMENFPARWVSFIDLKMFVNFFKMDLLSKPFVEIAFELCSKDKSKFERELFFHLFDKGKVSLFLDGFDEISPFYKETVSGFFKKFQKENGNQLRITTRSHLQCELENLFGVTSYQLLNFDKIEQADFFRGCCKKKFESGESDLKLGTDFQSIVKKFTKVLGPQRNIIGVPLLIEMIAANLNNNDEILQGDVSDKDAFWLYEQYVEKYVSTWRHDKGELAKEDQRRTDKSEDTVLIVHQKISLKHLFTQTVEQFGFAFDYDEEIWTAETLARIGLIRFIDMEPHFLHQSFAEFFSAKHIVFNLKQTKRRLQALKMIFQLLEEQRSTPCHFLDLAIKNSRVEDSFFQNIDSELKSYLKTKKSWGKIIKFIVLNKIENKILPIFMEIARQVLTKSGIKSMLKEKDQEGKNIIALASVGGNDKIIRELFGVLGVFLSKTEICEMFHTLDNDCNNCCHNAACNSSSVVGALIKLMKSYLSEEEQKAFLRMRGFSDRNIFLRAVTNKYHKKVLSALVDQTIHILGAADIHVMLKECDRRGMNIIVLASVGGNEEVLHELFGVLKDFLSDEEIRKMFQSPDNDNDCCIHRTAAFNSSSMVEALTEIMQSYLPEEEQKNFLRMRGLSDRNIFLRTATNKNHEKVLTTLIYKSKQILGACEVRMMLRDKDRQGMNIIALASVGGDEKILHEVLGVLKKLLTTEEICQMFQSPDNDNDCCIHRTAAFNSSSVVEALTEVMQSYLSKEERKNFLKMRGFSNRNIFLRASTNKNHEKVLTSSIDKAKQILGADEVQMMLKDKDKQGMNIIALASVGGDEKILHELLGVLKNVLSTEEICQMFRSLDNDNDHCWHHAACNSSSMVKALTKIIKSYLTGEEQRTFLRVRGFSDRNIFLRAATNKNHEKVLTTLIGIVKEILGDDEAKMMLKEKDKQGMNIISITSFCGNEEVLRELFAVLREFLGKEEIREMFYNLDNDNDHWFHVAVGNSSSIVDASIEILQFYLSEEEQKIFLRTGGFNGRNIFQRVTMNQNHENVLSALIDNTKQILGADEVRTMLRDKDRQGMNIIAIASAYGSEEVLRELLRILEDFLGTQEICKMFQNCDSDNDYCTHRVAAFNSSSVVEALIEIMKCHLSGEEQKNFLRRRGSTNRNIFLRAAMNKSHEKVLSALVDQTIHILGAAEIHVMLKECDRRGMNIIALASVGGNEEVLREVFGVLKDFLSDEEEIREMFQSLDNDKDHCCHNAACNSPSVVEALFDIMKSYLSKEEQKNFLRMRGFSDRNIFLRAATNKNHEKVLTTLIDNAKQILSSVEIQEMLKTIDEQGMNIIALTSAYGNEKLLRELFIVLGHFLTNEDIRQMFHNFNNDNDHCFHNAAGNSSSVVEALIEILKSYLSEKEQRNFLKLRGISNRNIFLRAATNKNHEKVLTTLIDKAKQILGADDIQIMLRETDNQGMNIITLASVGGDETVLRELFVVLKDSLKTEEIREMFYRLDADNDHCCHNAAGNSSEVVAALIEIMKSYLSEEDQKTFLRMRGYNDRNIFLRAATNQNDVNVLSTLIDKAKQILGADEVQIMLQDKDNQGMNIIALASVGGDEKSVQEISRVLRDLLSTEEICDES